MDKNGFGATKIKKNKRMAQKAKIKLNKESNQKKKA
jgi:hypothetical protein